MFGLGMQEVLVIALIILLLFGGKKIPELMNGLGKGVKSFKDGMNGTADGTKDTQRPRATALKTNERKSREHDNVLGPP